MTGIRQKRRGIGDDTGNGFDGNKSQVQRDADAVAPVAAVRRMAMIVVVMPAHTPASANIASAT